jgi:very-short-patch-repair endonuclease
MTRLYRKLIKKAKKRAYLNPLSIKEDLEKKAKKMTKKMTSPERIFESILKKYKINYKPQHILGTKIFDYYLTDSNTLIEIDGDYWHGNPEIYEEFNKMQKRTKKRDIDKKNIALGRGYNFLQFWEKDLNENKQDVVDKLIELKIIKK